MALKFYFSSALLTCSLKILGSPCSFNILDNLNNSFKLPIMQICILK